MTQTSVSQRTRMSEAEAKSFRRYSIQNAAKVAQARPCGCQPYVDVFTFNRWKSQGYSVKKGEKAIRIPTIIEDLRLNEETETYEPFRRLWTSFVFCRHQVRPVSKEAQDTEREKAFDAYEEKEHFEGLKETLVSHPARDLVKYVQRSGNNKGELHQLTQRQFTELTGSMAKPAAIAEDGKHVRWEYSLDQLAAERGLEDGQAVKEAAEEAARMSREVKALS